MEITVNSSKASNPDQNSDYGDDSSSGSSSSSSGSDGIGRFYTKIWTRSGSSESSDAGSSDIGSDNTDEEGQFGDDYDEGDGEYSTSSEYQGPCSPDATCKESDLVFDEVGH